MENVVKLIKSNPYSVVSLLIALMFAVTAYRTSSIMWAVTALLWVVIAVVHFDLSKDKGNN